jgi:uncharacterized protein (DUF2384 family)
MHTTKTKVEAKRSAKAATSIPGKTKSTKKINGALNKHAQNATAHEFSVLKDVSGYNNEELATLIGTTHRTIRNKKTNGELFDIAQTERLRKLNQLFTEGNLVFGSKEQFSEWLEKPSYAFNYNIPSELLKQPGGLDKVLNELISIKFGDTV